MKQQLPSEKNNKQPKLYFTWSFSANINYTESGVLVGDF